MASELDTVYKVTEMDEKLMHQKYMLIISAIIIAGAIISGILIILRYITAKRKNKALAANIDQLIMYRRRALMLEQEKYSKEEPIQDIVTINDEEEDTADKEEYEENDGQQNGLSKEDSDKMARFIYELTSRKLFVDPNFNRDILIDELRIQKRTFTKVFEAYTGSTYKEYITSIRLEHAAQLIKEHPEYTIEAIAMECGITSYVTFHRNFTRHFGIAPSLYRTQL